MDSNTRPPCCAHLGCSVRCINKSFLKPLFIISQCSLLPKSISLALLSSGQAVGRMWAPHFLQKPQISCLSLIFSWLFLVADKGLGRVARGVPAPEAAGRSSWHWASSGAQFQPSSAPKHHSGGEAAASTRKMTLGVSLHSLTVANLQLFLSLL